MKKNPISKGPINNPLKPPTPKTPKPKDFKNYEKALEKLDNAIIKAINVFVDGLHDEDKWYRYNCASVILRKVVPDRKIKEIVGDRDRPISFEFRDMTDAMEKAIEALDDMDIEMIQRDKNASTRVFEPVPTGERDQEKEMEEKEGTFVPSGRAEDGDRRDQGNESLGSSEAGL